MNICKRSLFALLALASSANSFAQSIYRVVDLGTFGGTRGEASAINSAGNVVGWADAPHPNGGFAFLYSGGPLLNLGTLPGGNGSQATSISDAGSVAGYAYIPATNRYQAFQIVGGSMTSLGTLGRSSFAYGMNSSGQIVGGSSLSGQEFHACLYSGGAVTDLGTLWNTSVDSVGTSVAFDINDSGVIVGRSTAPGSNISYAVRWTNGVIKRLDSPEWVLSSEARSINNAGVIVGNLYREVPGPNNGQHAMLYSGNSMIDLGHFSGPGTEAMGLNETGDAVGWGYESEFYGPTNGFVTSGTSIINLNRLIDSAYSDWSIQAAYAINDDGIIAGSAKLNQGNARPVLLVPISKPSTFGVRPRSLEIVRGTILRGVLSHCAASDGRLLVIKPKQTLDQTSIAQIELSATSPVLKPSTMRFMFDAHGNDTTIWDSVQLYDYEARQWVQIRTGSTDVKYSRQTLAIPNSNPTRFVQSGTGQMKVRITWTAYWNIGRIAVSLDRASWLLTE